MKSFTATSGAALALTLSLLLIGSRSTAQQAPARPTQPPVPPSSYDPKSGLGRTEAGPLTHPIVVEIAKSTYLINEFGLDTQYLLVGSKRALLIDTGSGFFDLRGLVEKMTSLPYDVVITDAHWDHDGARGQFDAIWAHPADVYSKLESTPGDPNSTIFNSISQHWSQLYGELMWGMPEGYQHIWGYTPADAKWGGWDKHPAIKLLSDNQIFDLGGRKVQVYHVPGHTMGACIYLDEQNRILFAGDIAKRAQGTGEGTASQSLRALLKIKSLRPRFDRLYSAHNAYPGVLDVLSQDPQVLDDLIEDYREVLRGTATTVTHDNPLVPGKPETLAVYGWAEVNARPDAIWVPGEPHVVP